MEPCTRKGAPGRDRLDAVNARSGIEIGRDSYGPKTLATILSGSPLSRRESSRFAFWKSTAGLVEHPDEADLLAEIVHGWSPCINPAKTGPMLSGRGRMSKIEPLDAAGSDASSGQYVVSATRSGPTSSDTTSAKRRRILASRMLRAACGSICERAMISGDRSEH